MCNLYDLDVPAPFIQQRFGVRRMGYDDSARAGTLIRPSVKAPVVHLAADGEVRCSLMEWGFVREWNNDGGRPSLHRLFNVRSETIDIKPSFAAAYRKTRAIIPASGWWESPEKNVNVRITRDGGGLIALAGLWEEAVHPRTGEPITAFTMAMTDHNPFTATYHARMPVLLDARSVDAWLDPQYAGAKKLLTPYGANDLVAARIEAPARAESKQEPAPVVRDLFG